MKVFLEVNSKPADGDVLVWSAKSKEWRPMTPSEYCAGLLAQISALKKGIEASNARIDRASEEIEKLNKSIAVLAKTLKEAVQ